MTFAEQLRDIQDRAAHSTEPGRIVAELAGLIADAVDLAAPKLATAEPVPADPAA